MTNQVSIRLLNQIRHMLLNSNSWLPETHNPINEAFDMAISALQSQDLQPTCNNLATDTISRKTAIDALCRRCDLAAEDDEPCTEKCNDIKILEKLPSAQPELGKNTMPEQPKMDKFGVKTGETCADTISRQAAIDAFGDVHPLDYNAQAYLSKIKALPSAQPEIVRCKDCKHRASYWGNCRLLEEKYHQSVLVDGNSFCSMAERRTDESD